MTRSSGCSAARRDSSWNVPSRDPSSTQITSCERPSLVSSPKSSSSSGRTFSTSLNSGITTEICGRSIRFGDNTQRCRPQPRLARLAARMRCDGMTSTTKEFREFLLKQNAFALAIGVIIGAAIGKVVSGIVEDVLMPVIGLVLPGGEWRGPQLTPPGPNALKNGALAGRAIGLFVIGLVVFPLLNAVLAQP